MIKSYIEQNRERFLEELYEWLRIPSVSSQPQHNGDMQRAAQYIRQRIEEAGADHTELCPTEGFPIVYGEKIVDPDFPTVLVYGHYDVQPPEPYDLWESEPFEPTLRGEKIYARGASDDKGQVYMQVKAFETMVATGQMPCNIKFLIEGEEEVGSSNLETFLRENRQKLSADVVLISDTGLISNEVPSVDISLRGLSYLLVEVQGPNRDLHSGIYGGAVDNPLNVLCRMMAQLQDDQHRITVPGFYDDVLELAPEEREKLAQQPFDTFALKNELGVHALPSEAGFSTLESRTIRPALDLNGIWGGYTGEGAKTIIPAKAFAKVSMRLVPNQSSQKISELVKSYLEEIAPATVDVKVGIHHGGEPAYTPPDSPEFQAAEKAFEDVWGQKPLPTREGASIPIVAYFEQTLGLKSILLGFGLESDAIHSPNESFGLFNFFKGMETIPAYFRHFALLKQSGALTEQS